MSDQTTLTKYDDLLGDGAEEAAIVIRERLRPVQGPRGVFFPPTFAGIGQGKKSDYHIDRLGPLGGNGRDDPGDPDKAQRDGLVANRCTVDSVPSQANRLEARLLRYSGTRIPRVTISGSGVGQRPLDLLEIGHRVADAAVRYTANNGFQPFENALRAFVAGDAGPLARLAPTSLVFGHWDSRDSATSKSTKSKARRLVRSEIVAYNVARATKRSQYWSSIDPEVTEELGQVLAEAKEAAGRDPETKNPASQLGMTDVPAPEASVELVAEPSVDREKTLALRRYLFALALASVADPAVSDLREGCILVRNGKPPAGNLRDGEEPWTGVLVCHTGEEKPFTVPSSRDAEAYLEAATTAFFPDGLPPARPLTFDPTGARAAVEARGSSGDAKKKEPTKPELVADLMTFGENKGQKTKLGKLGIDELRTQWRTAILKDLASSPEWAGKEADLEPKANGELREIWRATKSVGASAAPAEQT
jgi:CRISPR-associated protein Csb1